jgi:hypothetical protein
VLLVSSTTRDTRRYGYPSRQPAEVLAVLVDNGSARAVASVAVQEAVARHAPVRFIQVLSPQLDDGGRSIAEETMFRDGLRALRGHPRTHSVFEVLRGHAPETIRSRSRNAELLGRRLRRAEVGAPFAGRPVPQGRPLSGPNGAHVVRRALSSKAVLARSGTDVHHRSPHPRKAQP